MATRRDDDIGEWEVIAAAAALTAFLAIVCISLYHLYFGDGGIAADRGLEAASDSLWHWLTARPD